jgi:hypothetical protein
MKIVILISIVFIPCILSCSKCSHDKLPSSTKNIQDNVLPDISRLKEGITLSEAQDILGAEGRLRENPSPCEAVYDFDYDMVSIILVVKTVQNLHLVEKVIIYGHGRTAAEAKAERSNNWSEWVEKHRTPIK